MKLSINTQNEMMEALNDWERAVAGDSNDAEHEAGQELADIVAAVLEASQASRRAATSNNASRAGRGTL